MKNTQSLKLNRDFRRVYKSENAVGGYTVVYARKNKYSFNRLGLTVNKSFGKAVKRNRVKRLIRGRENTGSDTEGRIFHNEKA